MGIDAHAFNFITRLSARAPLGRVLTVGRQALSVDSRFVREKLGPDVEASRYCEPTLMALGATSVDSLDCSDYEQATLIVDLGKSYKFDRRFETIIDCGSLEHIFDAATAFRNVVDLCEVGGRIMHYLPVNNLSGHGFWQFSSDLLYAIYCERNGFCETEVFYASSLDPTTWFRMPEAKPGIRVEIVSLEPIMLLSVTHKVADVERIEVSQPFYAPLWSSKDVSKAPSSTQISIALKRRLMPLIPRDKKGAIILRNLHLLVGLITGTNRYALRHQCERKIDVERTLKE